ncbi:SRPBCC family protein [Nonomuraea rhodomycinica]|uniref:Carbon monoxide dehydrogenase subunit G n=1 Tax=Nonomuraea rhodomycinica TaxID=1712872 RepID=A0A7Y6MF08_9ACTN|nr:carbon monoxide dehydrogenase subunit G [Nonomuraea rhodomycinica]NUW44284.1 carbon monoxide dehydrogenase subunit G [Nonomuraea rhodomycinica]
MKVAGSAVIGVDRDRVWAALRDPAVLVRTIPGCERLEESGPDTYRMTVNAGVASVRGVYQGEVALADPLAPESFVLRARGQGAPGTVDATVQVRLSEVDGGTRVDYDADAVVGGMIGGVGQRMLGAVARRTAGEFFSAVDRLLSGPAQPSAAQPSAAVPVGAPGAGGAEAGSGAVAVAAPGTAVRERPAVHERPAGERAPSVRTETRPWVMLASFGTGAGVALTGVAVGWLLARSGRRH